jgi:membrane-bound lytic murein transglycosylase A
MLAAGCSVLPVPQKPAEKPPEKAAVEAPPPKPVVEVPLPKPVPPLQAVAWESVDGWGEDDLGQAWDALLAGCGALKSQPAWQKVCTAAPQKPGAKEARAFFESHFTPYRLVNADGSDEGMITGYYEPLLKGSRQKTGRYRYPLYGVPDDLLVVDLSALYPDLRNLRLRGRLDGRKVIPYYTRADIDNGEAPLKGRELFWVDDAIDLFFLHIQGSGRIQLADGSLARVNYADQNGHQYQSIGRLLVERGELTLDKASMQGIKDWAVKNPGKVMELLNSNPSYVFFRELPYSNNGPLGALGVPLTDERSLAVDPRSTPLGAPVFLSTTWPNSGKPLKRLMLAQDTGGAIKGVVRADFFWGFGAEAGKLAGAMKQKGRMWVLLPKDYPVNGS